MSARSMALPTSSAHVPSRSSSRIQAAQLAQKREQEAQRRQQCELRAQYFREQIVRSQRHAVWSSSHSYQQSMSAYQKRIAEEEKDANLERRRNRLRAMFQEEQEQFEVELRDLTPNRITLAGQLVQKSEELRTAREERRKKLAQELLREHWKKNNPEFREVESALHKDHVVSQWPKQVSERKQREMAEQEEKRDFEIEYDQTQKEALERMKEAEEKKKMEEQKRAEELCQQMEELKLREEEATHLKKEQDALLVKQRELEKIDEERRAAEERRKKREIGHFLIRQYRAQLRRKARQVQEELDADRKILASLLVGEEEDKRLETARKEKAIADAAWMKRVVEEQIQLEQEREAEFDMLHREEAQHVWQKREAQWEKERKAREWLMREVLVGRQQQLELKVQQNRKAQEESLGRREELIRELEQEKEMRRQERAQEEGRRTAWLQEINAQVEQKQREQREQCRVEQETEEDREALRIQEEELRLEKQRMAKRGYQDKIYSRPRTAWN